MKNKYVVTTDVHLHEWGEFSHLDTETGNSRLTIQINNLKQILNQCRTSGATLLFLGDLYHQRSQLKTSVFNAGFSLFLQYKDVPVIMLEGNHDNITNSIHSASSLEPFKALPNVTLVEEKEVIELNGDTFACLSYGNETSQMKQFIKDNTATALLAHLGVHGSLGAGNAKLEGEFTIADLHPKNYGLVLLGHYHKWQTLASNSFYVGNPLAQNFGEANDSKGYMTFETDNSTIVPETINFHELEGFPKFLAYDADKVPKDIDKLAEGNYVRVRGTKEETDNIPQADNIKVEQQYQPSTDTRLDIETLESPITITEQWAKEYQSDNVGTLVDIIKEAVNAPDQD